MSEAVTDMLAVTLGAGSMGARPASSLKIGLATRRAIVKIAHRRGVDLIGMATLVGRGKRFHSATEAFLDARSVFGFTAPEDRP